MGNASSLSICPYCSSPSSPSSPTKIKDSNIYVFLGGACGTTTWRKDVAIPLLEKHGIRYYNPQVEYWKPEFVKIEKTAMDQATHLLFVMSPKTRGIATFVEVGYNLGLCPKRVVLVDLYTRNETYNSGNEEESKDVCRGRDYILDYANQMNKTVFKSIEDAIKSLD